MDRDKKPEDRRQMLSVTYIWNNPPPLKMERGLHYFSLLWHTQLDHNLKQLVNCHQNRSISYQTNTTKRSIVPGLD